MPRWFNDEAANLGRRILGKHGKRHFKWQQHLLIHPNRNDHGTTPCGEREIKAMTGKT
jgi:hypothetical protein